MGGAIEYTRSDKTKKFIRHIDNVKKKNAKVCLKCESNKDGFCEKHKGWCNKVNYICNGFEMSYQEKIQQNKIKKETKKSNKKSKKQKVKKINRKSELGQIIKPNFDETKYTRRKDL